MSTTSVPSNGEGFHVVVAEDGSLPASELARLGLRPGAHLRVVPEPEPAQERVSAFGYLAGVLSPEAAEALSAGIEAGKADRIETLLAAGLAWSRAVLVWLPILIVAGMAPAARVATPPAPATA